MVYNNYDNSRINSGQSGMLCELLNEEFKFIIECFGRGTFYRLSKYDMSIY